jgi:hypothetical protein
MLKQLAAASRTVLLSYWLAQHAPTPDGGRQGIRLHTLPAAAEIESLVRQHQEAIHRRPPIR